MTYRLLAPALDDLDNIDNWVTTNFGERAASRTRFRLNNTFAMLAKFQQAGSEHPEITARPVRFFSSSPNWIVYEPGSPMLIHRIFPALRDIQTLKF